MMSEKIVVPVLGESITEATVSKWLKNEGDTVEVDEPIVELETDKVNLEVPSPVSGVLSEINSKDGATVEVGALLGSVSKNGKDDVKKNKINKKVHILSEDENISDKGTALDELINNGFPSENICAIGDDIQDLSLFRHSCVTLKITVRDGHPRVIEEADFVTKRKGGEGIMLEVCELLNGVNQ